MVFASNSFSQKLEGEENPKKNLSTVIVNNNKMRHCKKSPQTQKLIKTALTKTKQNNNNKILHLKIQYSGGPCSSPLHTGSLVKGILLKSILWAPATAVPCSCMDKECLIQVLVFAPDCRGQLNSNHRHKERKKALHVHTEENGTPNVSEYVGV